MFARIQTFPPEYQRINASRKFVPPKEPLGDSNPSLFLLVPEEKILRGGGKKISIHPSIQFFPRRFFQLAGKRRARTPHPKVDPHSLCKASAALEHHHLVAASTLRHVARWPRIRAEDRQRKEWNVERRALRRSQPRLFATGAWQPACAKRGWMGEGDRESFLDIKVACSRPRHFFFFFFFFFFLSFFSIRVASIKSCVQIIPDRWTSREKEGDFSPLIHDFPFLNRLSRLN